MPNGARRAPILNMFRKAPSTIINSKTSVIKQNTLQWISIGLLLLELQNISYVIIGPYMYRWHLLILKFLHFCRISMSWSRNCKERKRWLWGIMTSSSSGRIFWVVSSNNKHSSSNPRLSLAHHKQPSPHPRLLPHRVQPPLNSKDQDPQGIWCPRGKCCPSHSNKAPPWCPMPRAWAYHILDTWCLRDHWPTLNRLRQASACRKDGSGVCVGHADMLDTFVKDRKQKFLAFFVANLGSPVLKKSAQCWTFNQPPKSFGQAIDSANAIFSSAWLCQQS